MKQTQKIYPNLSKTKEKAMRSTANTLPVASRRKMIPLLNQLQADALGLYTHAKQAHWNVLGPTFIALHELFDEVAKAALDISDEVAERAIQLGGEVEGTLAQAAARATLPNYPRKVSGVDTHVKAVVASLAHLSSVTRDGVEISDKAGDAVTNDMLTGITATLDKYIWFVEAHVA